MNDWIDQLCGANFMPHGQCYLWTTDLITLHAVSDSLIALSYFSIPLALFYFVRKRRDVPYPGIFLMFALFIISCGATHALEVWTIWHGDYYLTGAVKALTAVASLATVVALVRIMPEALQLTGPAELRRLNESLEQRVRERTAELEKAHAANARYAAIVASSQDAIIGIDLQRRITDWNQAAQKIFGHDEREVVGRDAGIIIPEDRREAELTLLDSIAGGAHPSPIESIGVTRQGQAVDLSIMISPILNEAGQIVGFSKLARDISERRATERRSEQLEAKIQETQKLESLGVLAGGIAHDFNNLLTGIVGNATLAAMNLPAHSPIGPYLTQIENASMRAAELCSQMLAYSGRGQFSLKKLDLNQLVRETTQLLNISISKAAVLRQNLAERLPPVEGDQAQLRQIIMNLVINASEAIGERSGVIAITSGVVRVDEDYLQTLRHQGDIKLGDYVFLEVSDSGCGMDAQTLARVFEPFFTTKFTGRGLGLAAVLGIVRGHHGALKVYSEPGRGTTFKLLLPACEGSPDALAADQAPVTIPKSEGVVMVVDDEETVRTVAARLLEDMGYTVELAEDGRVAVEKFKAAPARYRLILLDLTMPHLNGEETFRQLRHLRPGVAVVLMSGYNEQEAVSGFTGKGLAGFVQKPFSARVFQSAIHNFMLMH